MAKNTLYQRPIARDLSGFAVDGAKPKGACISGSTITNNTCLNGVRVAPGDNNCVQGAGVGSAECAGGGVGVTGCFTGSTHKD